MKKAKVGAPGVRQGVAKTRPRHTPELRARVLERCDRAGVAVTAADVGLRESMLYAWRKAAMQSWNRSLKTEAICGERFTTRRQARAAVFEYIEIYYNRRRLHQSIGYRTPNEFEAAKLA